MKTVKERFEEKIEMIPECGCWIWMGTQGKSYGRFKLKSYHSLWSHRAAWIIYNGTIPEGLCVLHRCDTPLCVNPHHLFLGTHGDNVLDKMKKGRCPSGSNISNALLTEAKVAVIRQRLLDGERQISLAKAFGVARSTIHAISKHIIWRHVNH